MNKETRDKIDSLLLQPELLLKKKPFFRGCDTFRANDYDGYSKDILETVDAKLPLINKTVISQSRFLKELDPASHDILFDDNIPSICQKMADGNYYEIKYKKMSIPYQIMIKDKQVLCLCGNQTQFTLDNQNPIQKQKDNFTTFKQYWKERNQDGMRTRIVDSQLSMGDVGWLFYYDFNGQIKSRKLSYADGYVILPVNDKNGDRIIEAVYYSDEEGVEHLDVYDDTYFYPFTNKTKLPNENNTVGWYMGNIVKHGFPEIPLITKRGDVAWNAVQSEIEVYEIIYNIFMVIQKRFGWGILYIKGKFSENVKKIAGSVILNDTSPDGQGSAEFKTPPSPEGIKDTLQMLDDTISKGAMTTFILPKDIKVGGDVSGVAVQMVKEADIITANKNKIEWQNVINKAVRLFKHGLATELVNTGKNKTAITDFQDLRIGAQFKIWQPRSESEYNQMLTNLKASGLISAQTGIEKNTESTPDELARIENEAELAAQKVIDNANNNLDNNNNV